MDLMLLLGILGGIGALFGIPAAIAQVMEARRNRQTSASGTILLKERRKSRTGESLRRSLTSSDGFDDFGGSASARALRIGKVVGDCTGVTEESLAAWLSHLRRSILMPLDAVATGQGGLPSGVAVVVRRVVGATLEQGVIVQIMVEGEVSEIGLHALRAADSAGEQQQIIADYAAWFEARGSR